MYRLASADELWDIGWEDYLARGAVCAVEWSENVEGAFCGDEIRVVFEKTGESSRLIRIEGCAESVRYSLKRSMYCTSSSLIPAFWK